MGRYENHEVALNCGTVLREAFKHEQLAKIVLYSPVFWSFFDYVETGVFDVAGDAFSTFKVGLACFSGVLMPGIINTA